MAANSFVVVLGMGATGMVIEGPFATSDKAQAHADEHMRQNPAITATVDILVNPENC